MPERAVSSSEGVARFALMSPQEMIAASERVVRATIRLLAAFCVILAVVIGVQLYKGNSESLFLAWVAAAAFTAGAGIAFLHSLHDSEEHSFAPVLSALNGFIGGFTVSDLLNPKGVVRTALLGLKAACGVAHGGAVVCVVVPFACVGFVLMYYEKTLRLNRATASASYVAKCEVSLLAKDVELITPERADSNAAAVAEKLKERPELLREVSEERPLELGKVFFASKKYDDAIKMFEKAEKAEPLSDETRNAIRLWLANGYMARAEQKMTSRDRYDREKGRRDLMSARSILEDLVSTSGGPVSARKLLGWVYLWPKELQPGDPIGMLHDSVRLTSDYLNDRHHAKDLGARANLIAAWAQIYGQLKPANALEAKEQAFQRVVQLSEELIKTDISWRDRLMYLSADKCPEDDFADWDGARRAEYREKLLSVNK